MTCDAIPRTPTRPEREGMERMIAFGGGCGALQGSGGKCFRSEGCEVSGEDGEDGEDNSDPLACARAQGVWGSNPVLLTRRSDLSSPSSPSPPDAVQVIDISCDHPLRSCRFILSRFLSILSIPSGILDQNQRIVGQAKRNTRYGGRA